MSRRSGSPARSEALTPDEPEVTGLLALLLLTDARREARTGDAGEPSCSATRTAADGTRPRLPRAPPCWNGRLTKWFASALVGLYQDYRRSGTGGYAAQVTGTVRRLTGRPARSLDNLLGEITPTFAAT